MAATPDHTSRITSAALAAAAATHSTHATAGVLAMRVELAVYAVIAVGGAAVADVVDAPDFATRALMILCGTLLGSVAAAFAFDNASGKERASRGLLSLSAGPIISYVALSMWPTHGSFDPREWIIAISGSAAFAAWALVRWLQKRAVIDSVLDAAAEKVGLKTNKRKRHVPDEHEQGGP